MTERGAGPSLHPTSGVEEIREACSRPPTDPRFKEAAHRLADLVARGAEQSPIVEDLEAITARAAEVAVQRPLISRGSELRAWFRRLFPWLAIAVVVRTTGAVLLRYGEYIPPDFDSDFLHGRASYFSGIYGAAFYSHLLAGPPTLLLGSALLVPSVRRRAPRFHRPAGRVQVALVLLVLCPSGFVMAFRAIGGPVATAGFASLSIATAVTAAAGLRAARRGRFAMHEVWMRRNYALLTSAVVIRLMGGSAVLAGVESPFFDPIAAWACWLLPAAVGEGLNRRSKGILGDTFSAVDREESRLHFRRDRPLEE